MHYRWSQFYITLFYEHTELASLVSVSSISVSVTRPSPAAHGLYYNIATLFLCKRARGREGARGAMLGRAYDVRPSRRRHMAGGLIDARSGPSRLTAADRLTEL